MDCDEIWRVPWKAARWTLLIPIVQGAMLYVNDLPNCVDELSVRSFADDTNLFYSSDNLKQLEFVMNQELKQIYNYCALNKLSINTAKTII